MSLGILLELLRSSLKPAYIKDSGDLIIPQEKKDYAFKMSSLKPKSHFKQQRFFKQTLGYLGHSM